jgi:hypothetical protein
MKTQTLSESRGLVGVMASVWDRILGLGQWIDRTMDRKEAELDRKSLPEQMKVIVPVTVLALYLGLGLLRCSAVILVGAKVVPDMAIDWWWVALVKLIS